MQIDDLVESAENKILTSDRKDGPTQVSSNLSTGHSDPSEKWLLALQDKDAALYTTSSNICFVDVHSRGDMNLIIVDMGNGFNNIKMNVYRGGSLLAQLAIIDVPSATVPFFLDSGEAGRTPAIAVASGHYLYIYKSLKPFYKFQLPALSTNQTEIDAWTQVKEDKIDVETLKEILASIAEQPDEVPLTSRSRKLLTLNTVEEMNYFVKMQKEGALKRTTVITCMTTVKRSMIEQDALSCLVVGTENKDIYFIESEAFTVLSNYSLPSEPVFIDVTGLFDVEFRLIVSCRDASIYVVKRGSKHAKQVVHLVSQPVGLVICNSSVIVGCMDKTLSSYSSKGSCLWSIEVAAHILTIESIEIEMLASSLVAVALANKQVHIFHDKHHVDVISTADNITSMKFGKYGRESATLVMVSQTGALTVMILKRTVKFMPFKVDTDVSASTSRLTLPKKTKLFVEQAVRERCEAFYIHRAFQQDLYRLKLTAARAFVTSITNTFNPISTNTNENLKLSAAVHGLGPVFRLVIEIVNNSLDKSLTGYFLSFYYDVNVYQVERNFLPIPYLVRNYAYAFQTKVKCISKMNVTDSIKVIVMKEGELVPTVAATVNMPASESHI